MTSRISHAPRRALTYSLYYLSPGPTLKFFIYSCKIFHRKQSDELLAECISVVLGFLNNFFLLPPSYLKRSL
jgi:hypothetical protein